jgi:4-hydroxybenzoate polyprenyltransferase
LIIPLFYINGVKKMTGKVKGLVITMRPVIGLVTFPWVAAMALFASILYGDFSSPIHTDSEFLITLLLIMVGSYLGVTSGYALNDYFDSELDHAAGVRKDKAVTHGIKKGDLLAYSAILGAPSLIILFYLNILTGMIGLIQMMCILQYSMMKYKSPFSNFMVVLPTALMPIGVFFVYTPSIPLEAILLFILYFFYEPGFTWSGVCRDVDGDRKKGIPTLPVKYGIRATARFIFVSWTLVLFMSIILFLLTDLGIIFLIGSSLSAILLIKLADNLIKSPHPGVGAQTFFKSAGWFWFFSISLILELVLGLAGVSLPGINLL